jgi:GTP 3',8-cyclase
MSIGAYAPDKANCYPDRLQRLASGEQPYPVHLHLIPGDYCNLQCPSCAYRLPGYTSSQDFGGNPKRFLPLDGVKKVLDDCTEMGTTAIETTGGGEPTCHPQIGEILSYAQDKGLRTALITNGLLLNTRNLIPLTCRGSWARVSIDASTPETYAKVRPSARKDPGANLDLVLRNLSKMRNWRDKTGSQCVIGAGFVVQLDNWCEIYHAVKLYREYGADNVRISGLFTPQGSEYFKGWGEKAKNMERWAVKDFSGKDGFTVHGRFTEKLEDLMGPPKRPTCWYQHLTTYLGGNGNLYRCCVISYNKQGFIGNLADYKWSLKALWDSQMKQEKFAGFDARKCARCQFGDRIAAIDRSVRDIRDGNVCAAPTGVIHPDFI